MLDLVLWGIGAIFVLVSFPFYSYALVRAWSKAWHRSKNEQRSH
jgi:hypothetical protein